MLLAAEVLTIVLLLIALYSARRYAKRTIGPRAHGTWTSEPRLSARTEMRAFDALTTVTRTLDRSGMVAQRHNPRLRHVGASARAKSKTASIQRKSGRRSG